MDRLNFQKEIPVRHEVDVLVVGGGPAGVSAAVVAARQGCSVYLAETHSCLGGMGTAGLVPVFMSFSDGVNFLAGGFGEELVDRLHQAGGTGEKGLHYIKAEVLKRVYDEMVLEAKIDFTFHTQLIGVMQEGPTVTHGVFAAKSGLFAIKARMFVDGTGDGDLAYFAGAGYEKGDEEGNMMPGTLCSLWANVDWSKVKKPDTRRIEKAFEDHVFSQEDRHLPGMWKVSDDIGGGNIGHTFGVDSTDERSLTEALVYGRKSMLEYERYYKEYLTGYEDMELVATGSLLGIRESRRVLGDYVLNLQDFHDRAVFDDEIGRYNYPVDIHASRPDKDEYEKFEEEFRTLRYGKGESYGVPYRILLPKGLDNVLVTGRCVSSDRFLQGSIRVMPGCYITGQAAGMAAALGLAQNTSTRGFPVQTLQRKLKEIGGFLPNLEGSGKGGE